MAKKPISWWDKYHDDDADSESTKKSTGPRPNPHYNPEPDDELFVTGFGGGTKSAADDDRASDDYGGFGYSGISTYDDAGYSRYRYDEAFDDSDAEWYRRNSFRYSRKTDYSPSSLFRSTFSTRSWSSAADNNDKNKAIRALRNLTRNANTIVDKAVGQAKEYIVQFSNGADSNGLEAELNDKKQRVIYVSPDQLLATTTTDDEDAAIDALTGFVLLRVQISQDVAAEVVRDINMTGTHAAGVKAAVQFYAAQQKLSALKPREFAASTADQYLSGMLAKAMLMRLSRRQVVSNWGGFAPYFVRHAKKFEAVRETLSQAEFSLESVTARIAYNLINDETPLEVDPAVAEIVARHLGAEVTHDQLLPACDRIVADLRAWLASLAESGTEVAPGAVESALENMLADAQKAQSGEGKQNEAHEQLLEQMANVFADIAEAGTGSGQEVADNCEASDKLQEDIRKHMSVEQLLKSIEAALKELETAEQKVADGVTDAPGYTRSALNMLMYQLNSRPSGIDVLRDAGLGELDKARESIVNTPPTTAAELKALREKFEAAVDAAEEFCKKTKPALKAAAQAAITASRELTDKFEKLAAELLAKVAKAETELAENKSAPKSTRDNSANTLATLKRLLEHGEKYAKEQAKENRNADDAAAKARAVGPLSKACRTASYRASMTLNNVAGQVLHSYEVTQHGAEINNLRHAISSAYTDDPEAPPPDRKTEINNAVNSAKATSSVTDAGFLATMVDALLGGQLSKFAERDNYEDSVLAKLAAELGTTVAVVERLLAALRQAQSSGRDHSEARRIGEKAAETLKESQAKQSPIDNDLFGEKIDAKTTNLTGEAIGQVNDEARNEAEEEYVAYLSHNSTRPKTVNKQIPAGTDAKRVMQATLRTNRGAVEQIRNALQFQAGKRTIETYGLRSGELDEGNLHKLSYDCEHIWAQKTISKLPDVAVGILVDQSGSMNGGHKIEQARTMCILLAEALRKIAGVRLYVYGHTANQGGMDDMTIYEHYSPSDGSDLTRLGGIRAYSNNYDGYAIKEVARRLARDEAKKKYLFVIADGLPSGAGYGGEEGCKHVTSVCKFTRDRLKIGTYAFAVGVSGHYQSNFKRQYGDKQVVFVDRVSKCLPQIVRFLRNAMQQERKLVGIED